MAAAGEIRSWVLASLPQFCQVCGGGPRERVVIDVLARTVIPCPHCMRRLPIASLPMRVDASTRTPEETP